MEYDVLCVGVATLDRVIVVDTTPGEDERVLVERFTVAGGGPAATAAVTLARLGARVALCAVVGQDDAGRTVVDGLESEGVDVRWVSAREDVRTTESVILVSRRRGTRTIITTPSTAPLRDAVPRDVAPWLHADQTGYAAVRGATGAARGAGPKVSVDAGNSIAELDLSGVALYVPTVAQLLQRFPGDVHGALVAARAAGAGAVVATAGGDGAYLLDGDDLVHVPAVETEVVSTLGAGDVFHGALLAATVRGAGLAEAATVAATVAALSCRAIDGRSAIPHADDVRNLSGAALESDR